MINHVNTTPTLIYIHYTPPCNLYIQSFGLLIRPLTLKNLNLLFYNVKSPIDRQRG